MERRGGAVLCGLGRRGAGGCGCPAHPYPVVTMSDMGVGENARRAAVLGAYLIAGMVTRAAPE